MLNNRTRSSGSIILTCAMTCLLAACALAAPFPAAAQTPAAPGPEPAGIRLVLVGDPHFPFKVTEAITPYSQAALVKAKVAARDEINAWTDAERIVVLGDIDGERGTADEYRLASDYLSKFKAPLRLITGNHDYIYEDSLSKKGALLRDSPETRSAKLGRFVSTYGLGSLQRDEQLDGYELIYLCSDSLNLRDQVGVSPESLAWLEERLARNASLPTIIFFHAPLEGTLTVKNRSASGDSVAQPAETIKEILSRNPQVFLWVSGHTHTPPTDPGFDSPQNLYDGRVTDIHCTDLNRVHIYTNSLWLYPDHVEVRTYDHALHEWLARFDRRIAVPRR